MNRRRGTRLAVAIAAVATTVNLTAAPAAHAVQLCNGIAIIGTVSDGPANPYPSSITVSGLSGTITDVNVTILDFTTFRDVGGLHWAEDTDLMVSSPAGTGVILMSDAGGNNDSSSGAVSGADITFDQQAANQLPADSHLTSGTFRPVDDDNDVAEQFPDHVDVFDAPAPTPGGADLNVFNGQNPNGTWNLWSVEDMDQGHNDILSGWCVDITTTASSALAPPPADFDGDGDTDISVYRPSGNVWFTRSPATSVTFGAANDIPVPGDYDGDGNVDQAVFRPSNGVWFLRTNPPQSIAFGTSTDIPVPADYDGDGDTDIAVFRPSNGVWYIRTPASSTAFGVSGDIPVPADYNGDGKAERAVFRPSTGVWYISGPPASSRVFGANGDIPVPGDYNGDGKDEIAVFRPSNRVWYIGGPNPQSVQFGVSGDQPQPGDYDGDGDTDIAVYRPSNNTWFIGTPASAVTFGASGDIPLPLPNHIRRFFF